MPPVASTFKRVAHGASVGRAGNAESLTRARTALAGIERLERPNIAALSVALRTLRSVIRAGAAV